MKKILFITYYWPPSGGAGVQRSLKFVKYLSESGIEPIVITVDEKYASYPLIDESLLTDIDKNITVVKTKSLEALKVLSAVSSKKNIPHGGFSNSNKEKFTHKILRFIRGNLFIPDARVGWVRYAVKAAGEIIRNEKIDIVYISSPPHSSQLIGLKLKKKFNIRWIADMRDPWTDIYYYNDLLHTKLASKKDEKYELQVLKNADEVITVSEPIRQMFLQKSHELAPEKFHVLPNGFDENDFNEPAIQSKDFFIITYVGSIADSYNPEIFFSQIKKATEELWHVNIKIRFVGSMPESVRQLITKYKLTKYTEFISHVSHSKAVKYMMESAALLLFIPDVPNNEGILTGKIFEYLASKRPVIGLGPLHGEASKILQECNAGFMFERTDTEQLYSYLKSLILQWDKDNRPIDAGQAYLKYSRRALTKTLAGIIVKQK